MKAVHRRAHLVLWLLVLPVVLVMVVLGVVLRADRPAAGPSIETLESGETP